MKGSPTLVTLIALALVAPVAARADEEKIPLDKLPAAVVKAVKDKYPKAELKEASKEVEDGETIFEVSLADGGHGVDVSLKEDGAILEVEKEIPAADLPAAVAKAVKDKYPKGEVKKAEEVLEGEEKSYEVVVSLGDEEHELTLAPDGKILEDEEDD